MSDAKYFAILIVVLAAGLWVSILHHVEITQEWHDAGIKFSQLESQMKKLEADCGKSQ